MENEIKKLIEKWKQSKNKGYFDGQNGDILSEEINEDLQSLLEFKQNNCCGKQTPSGIKEVYEKFKHLDHLLSDKEWMTPDKSEVSPAYTICYELWRAIKNECS